MKTLKAEVAEESLLTRCLGRGRQGKWFFKPDILNDPVVF